MLYIIWLQLLPAKSCFRLGNSRAVWHIMSRSHFAQNPGVCRQVVLNIPSLPRCTLRVDEQGKGSQGGPSDETQAVEQAGRSWVPGEPEKILSDDRKGMQVENQSKCMQGRWLLSSVIFWVPLMQHACILLSSSQTLSHLILVGFSETTRPWHEQGPWLAQDQTVRN